MSKINVTMVCLNNVLLRCPIAKPFGVIVTYISQYCSRTIGFSATRVKISPSGAVSGKCDLVLDEQCRRYPEDSCTLWVLVVSTCFHLFRLHTLLHSINLHILIVSESCRYQHKTLKSSTIWNSKKTKQKSEKLEATLSGRWWTSAECFESMK